MSPTPYREEHDEVARRVLASWNRDPGSPSFGSFDRQFWGWKRSDFSDATLQAGVALALRCTEALGGGELLSPLLDGFVEFLAAIQHRDGSFDQCYPHERTPGVVYDMLPGLLAVRDSPRLSPRARGRLEEVLRRAAAYALASDETHGEIANHFASFGYEAVRAGLALGDERLLARGREYLERTVALFDEREGWFEEYHGPDAGYQSRCLVYTSAAAALLQDEALWSVSARAARFLEQLLQPDDSLHPMLGVRSTALLYPSGFERLAARDPAFRPLAARIRRAWAGRRVPLPSDVDMPNAIRYAEDAWQAAELGDPLGELAPEPPPQGVVHLPRAGIWIRREPDRVTSVAWRLGGVTVVHRRDPDGEWRLAHEDAGWLLSTPRERWVTRAAGGGRLVAQDDARLEVACGFARSLHEELTPARLLLLRASNLTVLRSQRLGDLFRKIVVRRLISGKETLPLELRRRIALGPEGVTIEDRIVGFSRLPRRLRGAALHLCRRVTGNHMASARYFQEQELTPPQPWLEPVAPPAGDLLERRREVRVAAAAQPRERIASSSSNPGRHP